jgi:Lon protease-like protein
MFELPLFPLNTVLFPGMPLRLHIFEERYKQMIGTCIETRQPFGVVLIRRGTEAFGPLAEPYSIGCTARIIHVQPLGQGRMDITAAGEERFQIHSLSYDRPYLVGLVERLPLDNRQPLAPAGRRLRPLVQQYLSILARAGVADIRSFHLPNDPLLLAYLAAILLQIPPHHKQPLLAASTAAQLLDDLLSLYRREVVLLDTIVRLEQAQSDGPLWPN